MLQAVGEATQQLEQEVQAVASSMAATSTQQMQTLVEIVWGELQAQMEASHQEAQRQQDMIRGEMKQITNDVQLLTKQLNDAKLVNKGMLS